MRSNRLLTALLAFATLSHAGWTSLRDATDGWKGDLALVPSDSSSATVAHPEFAVPWDATPASVQARLLPPGDTLHGTSVAFDSSYAEWSGARILHLRLRLSPAQRHSRTLAGSRIRLVLSWKGSLGSALLPIVRNTVANPLGGGRFGRRNALARTSSVAAPRLPEADRLVLAVDVGDLTKRDDRLVSRTDDDGILRLTGKDLRKVFGSLAGVSLSQVSVYRGPHDTLPTAAPGVLSAPTLSAVRVQRISHGADTIQDDDEIRFYAEGGSVWIRDSSAPCGTGWKLSASPFALGRRYLIALQPVSSWGQPVSGEAPAATASTAATAYATVRQTWSQELHQYVKNAEFGGSGGEFDDEKSGANWYWQVTSSPLTIQSNLSDAGIASDSACVEVSMADSSNASATTVASAASLSLNGNSGSRLSGSRAAWNLVGLKSSGNSLTLSGSSQQRLKAIAVHGTVRPRLSGSLEFPAPATGAVRIEIAVPSGTTASGIAAYAIENGELARVASVSCPSDTLCLVSDSIRTLSTRLRISLLSSMLGASSSVVGLSRWSPNAAAVTDFSQESGDSMLVIAPDSLVAVASAYASYRSSASPRRRLPTKVVRLEDIYLLHSGGAVDPTAIRDFLRWARANWGTSHALLLGNGTYDLRDMKKGGRVGAVPTWESGAGATDNYFAYLDSAEWTWSRNQRRVDIAVGRIPARSIADATAWLAKLKIFEAPVSGQDPSWRNTSFLVADDFLVYSHTGSDGNPTRLDDIRIHSSQTEAAAQQILANRPWNFQNKLFMASYAENSLGEKPEVRQAIIAQINKGTALFNYVGHGSATMLAHERAFDVAAIPSLSNASFPNLFFAAACAVGRFDDPDQEPLAAALVTSANRGSVASIAGMRATYPDPNGLFNTEFYRHAFDVDSLAAVRTIGEALLAARNQLNLDNDNYQYVASKTMSNEDAYVLLGDPAMPFSPTAYAASGAALAIDSLPDTLPALYRLQRTGSIASQNPTEVVIRFRDTAFVDTVTYTGYACPNCTYIAQETPQPTLSTLVSGSGGKFSIDAMIPAKIDFGRYGAFMAYALDLKTGIAAGLYRDHVLQLGTSTALSSDDVGPAIAFRPCDSSYSAGQRFSGSAKVHLPFCLQVDLSDSSGISSATGPDEGVTVNVPGILDTWRPSLTGGATYRDASFQMQLDTSKYETGNTYKVSVLAHDQMGNYSRAALQLEIQGQGSTSLYDVFNRPNPVKSGGSTAFYFKVSTDPDTNNAVPRSLSSSIRIHTLSGKLVRILRADIGQDGSFLPKAVWDLRDSAGNLVANGLYPYTVLLRIPGSNGSWSQVERRGVVAVSR